MPNTYKFAWGDSTTSTSACRIGPSRRRGTDFDMCWAFDLADPWGNQYDARAR